MAYMNNNGAMGLIDLCPSSEGMTFTDSNGNSTLLALYTDMSGNHSGLITEAVGTDGSTLVPNITTGRVTPSNIQSYVGNRTSVNGPIKPRANSTDAQVAQDRLLYASLQYEYCYYEARYRFALKRFLELATSRSTSDNAAAQAMLATAKTLNIRLNGLLEVTNYLAQQRIASVNTNSASVVQMNNTINSTMAKLKNNYALLSNDNAVLLTQREMVRYTAEKNKYTSNQLAAWIALNVVALGTIFYVYRN